MTRPKLLLPSDLLRMARQGILPAHPVSLDTETSGLYPDDGARVSTVSVGWADPEGAWAKLVKTQLGESAINTYGVMQLEPGRSDSEILVVSLAWPFDQGHVGSGKPEDRVTREPKPGMLEVEIPTPEPDTRNLPLAEWRALLQWLELVGPVVGLDMHHAKFDCHMMVAGCRRRGGWGIDLSDWVVWDTQNVADLFWSNTGTTSLKPTSDRIWPGSGATDEQEHVKNYLKKHKLPTGRWDLMPWSEIARYADMDARLTVRLAAYQRLLVARNEGAPWLDGKESRLNVRQAVDRRLETSKMLFRMEERGLPFDSGAAEKAVAQVHERIARAEQALPFSPATGPMAKHYWFGTGIRNGVQGQGLKPLARTPTGEPQLTANEIRKLVAKGYPGAEQWRDLSKLQTSDSMWYSGYLAAVGQDDRLRTNIKQNGTVSGRFSSTRVNVQAIPHDYKLTGFSILEGIPTPRQLIGSAVPEGYRLWELDLANAELRVAALMAGCGRMLDMIKAGMDLHGETAKELFHVEPDSPDWDQRRSVAKRSNFSLIFGVGPDELASNIEKHTGIVLRQSEAQVLVRDWNRLYPEYKRAIQLHMDRLASRKRKPGGPYLQMANGERRWFQPHEDFHKGFNQRVQPSLAQFGIDWWLASDAYISRELSPVELEIAGTVLLIHDSMVLLLPEDRDEKIVQMVQKIGVRLWEATFPGVPGGVDAKRWGDKG